MNWVYLILMQCILNQRIQIHPMKYCTSSFVNYMINSTHLQVLRDTKKPCWRHCMENYPNLLIGGVIKVRSGDKLKLIILWGSSKIGSGESGNKKFHIRWINSKLWYCLSLQIFNFNFYKKWWITNSIKRGRK